VVVSNPLPTGRMTRTFRTFKIITSHLLLHYLAKFEYETVYSRYST